MWTWEVSEPRGVIVIVHGAGEHHGRYKWLAEKWNEHGFEVIMGDLPGQGKSRGKRGHIQSFSQYIDVVGEWIEAARKRNLPILLLGHSMGGLIIIRLLMERAIVVHGVILSSPCLGLSQPPPKSKELATKLFHRITPTISAHAGIRTDQVTRNERVRVDFLKDDLRVQRVSLRWYQELIKAMRVANRYPEKFPNIPLLILQAGEDFVVNKFDVRDWFDQLYIQEKFYKEWDGLYHEVFNEPERDDVFSYAIGFANLHIP